MILTVCYRFRLIVSVGLGAIGMRPLSLSVAATSVCLGPILWLCALRVYQGMCSLKFSDLAPCFLSLQDCLMSVLVLFLGCKLGS